MTLEQILAGSFIPWPVILFFGYMCFIWLLDLFYLERIKTEIELNDIAQEYTNGPANPPYGKPPKPPTKEEIIKALKLTPVKGKGHTL